MACEKDQDCNVIYDLFCDDVGYFCICPLVSVVEQTHPRGTDCIYVKKTKTKNQRTEFWEFRKPILTGKSGLIYRCLD